MGISTSRLFDRRAYRGTIEGEYQMRSPSVASRSRTRGWRTATGPMPVMISRSGRWPWRTTRCRPVSVLRSACLERNSATSASTAWVSSARAPLRRISVRGSVRAPGWASLMTLLSDTAYHSFIGEVEALNTTTIRRLTTSRRHQLPAIALVHHNAEPTTLCVPIQSYDLAASQFVENALGDGLRCHIDCRHPDFRSLRHFVWRVETGEVLEPPRLRLGVKTFGIPADAFVERRVDEDLEKGGRGGQLADHPALGAERRDEGADHNESRLRHQLGDLADPPDVFDPVCLGETEVAVEAVPDIVAVEQHRVAAAGEEQLFDNVGNRRFPCPRQPGQPKHRR